MIATYLVFILDLFFLASTAELRAPRAKNPPASEEKTLTYVRETLSCLRDLTSAKNALRHLSAFRRGTKGLRTSKAGGPDGVETRPRMRAKYHSGATARRFAPGISINTRLSTRGREIA
jgi:hypothetical protein